MNEEEISKYNFKGLFKYIGDVVSWTIFTLLIIIAAFLLYYFVSVRLYATKGDRFEPRFSIYTIVSPSMEPTISVYDVILNKNVRNEDDVKVNDVITFISTSKITYGMTITHRVVDIQTTADGSKCFVTRGDNNTNSDEACVTKANLIGVVKAVIPGLGKIQSFLSSALGWLLIIIIPAIYIIIKDIFKLIRLSKDINKDNKNDKSNNNNKKEELKYSDDNDLNDAYKDLVNIKKE